MTTGRRLPTAKCCINYWKFMHRFAEGRPAYLVPYVQREKEQNKKKTWYVRLLNKLRAEDSMFNML